MADVLLVTCADLPDGERDGHLLVEDLAGRGIDACWVVWDDAAVDWSPARLVAVRSTWDYEQRRDEFLSWARALPAPLLNGADVFEWNTDKAYLAALAEEVPVVPTLVVDQATLGPAIASFDRAVVKPRVGAGGRGVVLFDGEPGAPGELDEARLTSGPWVVQPLVDSVRTEGETSVFVLGGEAVAQAQKLPCAGEIRVHESYGGRTDAVPLTEEAGELALRTVEAVRRRLGAVLSYARVDMMRLEDGTLAVSELEATEPGLYLEILPGNAQAFGRMIEKALL
jgi:glutathione synthase/RimK-type ligase-like ATP-grasp enzyme